MGGCGAEDDGWVVGEELVDRGVLAARQLDADVQVGAHTRRGDTA